MNICTLNKIAACGTDRLGAGYTVTDVPDTADGVMVRSAAMHDMVLPQSLLAIARAGAGVNNIPVDKCSDAGIVVFNTPGANANAVKELVIAGLLLSSRKVVPAIAWAKTLKGEGDMVGKLVEKGKSAFAGPEIAGKKLGVIGLGAIGVLVANAARALGMEVYGYDPFLSVDTAWKLSRDVHHAVDLETIYKECDYITVHVPLLPDTKGMLNADAFAVMKDGVRVLNFARDGLVNSADMLAALESGKVAAYVVDFPTEEMLKDYLENGNILHSVNFPDVQAPRAAANRICVLHKNVPNMLAQISAVVSAAGINIASMVNKSKKDYAYTLLDVEGAPAAATLDGITGIDGVIRVRSI